ncbi:NAD(P)/FAD-dependent oxidoreductase [Paenibacillus sp. FJAT-27812]|uniref:NAD(P)/FAD-dependent oxidoreductase n=1 Tax=Paenibacillus sp. FJAT-27812 TaxID=1684143 RepID=UPI0006A7D80F|nr:FAD-dependent oxidoreductase [Paenibacillus sp. FJAT-27812]
MKPLTCMIVGGGYAGINAVKAIRESLGEGVHAQNLRIVLIDKQPYHLRKVLLFKPASGEADITLPLKSLFPEGVQFVQGTVTEIKGKDQLLLYRDESNGEVAVHYDILVMAAGSVVRQTAPEQGGIALTGLEAAARIREAWLNNLHQGANETNAEERQRLLTLAVAGAGISGIETSAELAHAVRGEAARLGIHANDVKIYLLNAQDRLFQEGSPKMGRKLERALAERGVTVVHGQKALHEHEGQLALSGGGVIPVGLCVWSLGLMPNPMLRSMGLPLTPNGQLIVDASYRVTGAPGVYSIGDCACIVDPTSGQADRLTCKEATGQAARLGKIISADLQGAPAPTHKSYMDFYCIGLGPEQGMAWTQKWGLEMTMTGKLGWKIRKWTWDLASLIK